MRIQVKLTVVVFLVIVGTVAAVVWKTRDLLIQDRLGFIADSAMKQVAPLKHLTQDRLEEQKSRLIKFATARVSLGQGRAKAPSSFDVVALVRSGGNQWAPMWVEKSDVPQADLPAGFELTLLKSLPYARVRDGETFWVRLSDRRGAPLYAILVSVEIQGTANAATAQPGSATLPESIDYAAAPSGGGGKALVVGLSSSDPLADLTEDYIGSTNIVYIVDDKGYVASHVNKAYLGALFSEDPIVTEIINTRKTAASGNYQDLENRAVLGHFERIDRTNLYAVITTPLKATQDLASAHLRTSLSVATAVGLLGLLITWLFARQFEQPVGGGDAFASTPKRQLSTTDAGDQRPAVPPMPQPRSVEAAPLPAPASPPRPLTMASASTPMTTENVKVGFVNAVKEPLLAILGHAQLVKSKSDSEQVEGHAESIEREARRAKDIVDRLMSWSDQGRAPKALEALDLRAVVESVLQTQDENFKAEGIFVAKELHAVPKVRGSAEELKVALVNLLDNAREAMRARPKKHLRVQLEFRGGSVSLVIADSGVGMTRDVKERCFEPFYKSFESPDRVGLGLALVQRAVKNMDGRCDVQSSLGEGATFSLTIPVATEDKQLFISSPIDLPAETPRPPPRETVAAPKDAAPETAVPLQPVSASAAFTTPDKDFVGDEGRAGDESDHDDDDDDDDEKFASVPLSAGLVQGQQEQVEKAAKQPSAKPADEARPSSDPDEFRVRIRRPRVRS